MHHHRLSALCLATSLSGVAGVGVLVEGLGEEGGDGEGEEGGDHPAGGVAAIALALAVYHLHGLGACALNALVAPIQGTATDDAVVVLHCTQTQHATISTHIAGKHLSDKLH
jgi:hypothetical protein